MIIPIRCISCGKPVAQFWDTYAAEARKGKSTKKILDELGLKRYCCRQTLLTHAELIHEVGKFRV